MSEEHKNMLVHLRHGAILWISVRFEEKWSQQQTEQVSDMHTGGAFSKSHVTADETPSKNFHEANLINSQT